MNDQPHIELEDWGRLAYATAYARQERSHARVLEAKIRRESGGVDPLIGVIHTVEHDPVITISRRAEGSGNLLASEEVLRSMGVSLEPTDRGGDITFHGPGQIVVYPIIDLNVCGLGLHDHMRTLEEGVIRTLADFGIAGERDASATGVWTHTPSGLAKVCACGVRVRRWVSMHGLALNVETDARHFSLIVPCGLHGRPITSLRTLMGDACPPIADVREVLVRHLRALFLDARARASARRANA